MKRFCVILFVFLLINSSVAKPKPQETEDENTENLNPDVTTEGAPPDENTVKVDDDDASLTEIPGGALLESTPEPTTTAETKKIVTQIVEYDEESAEAAGLEKDKETTKAPDAGDGNDPSIIPPIVTEELTTDDPLAPIIIDSDDTTTEGVPAGSDECGPACQLANQAPFILFIAILVAIILLLIILFGCYFMKKLYGKTILTTTQNQSLPQHPSFSTSTSKVLETSKAAGSPVDSDTTQKIITTTTTKVTKSVGTFSDVAL